MSDINVNDPSLAKHITYMSFAFNRSLLEGDIVIFCKLLSRIIC